jgi:hypothetical protein
MVEFRLRRILRPFVPGFFNGDGATAMRIIANIRWVDAKAAIIIRYYIRAVLPSRDEIFNSIRSVLVFVKEENRMEVLVVDDSEVVADSLAFLLDCYGHHTTVARDGEGNGFPGVSKWAVTAIGPYRELCSRSSSSRRKAATGFLRNADT